MENLFEIKLWDMIETNESEELKSTKFSVDNIKEVTDFAGNEYLVIEAQPSGYMIYHMNSGTFVEYSLTSVSPYISYNSNLYYGGPTEYYVLETGVYKGILFDETYTQEEASEFAESCREADLSFMNSANSDALEYIENGSALSKESVNATNSFNISNYSTIKNMVDEKQMGYASGELCGYIASGIVLMWHYAHKNTKFLDSSYVTTTSSGTKCFKDNSFTKNLYNYHGVSNKTDAEKIRKVMSSYLTSKGITHY